MPYTRADSSLFLERVRAAVGPAMEQVASQADDALRQSLATPYPPASTPGNPPHLRTGALQNGVEHVVVEDEAGVSMVQGVSREGGNPLVPLYLEFGTGIHAKAANKVTSKNFVQSGAGMQPRPFMAPIKEEFGPQIGTALADALRELSTD